MSQTETNQTTPTGHTGPRTEEGKAISSRNARQHGLYAKEDFVLPDERDEHSQLWEILMGELDPHGMLEQVFVEEIMGAQWRLRRCRLVEATLVTRSLEDENFDDDKLDRKQRSIDRARAAAHSVLRRSMAELRRLQTERRIRLELGETESAGLTDTAQVIRTVELATADEFEAQAEPEPPRKRITLADLENLMSLADQKLCADIRSENPSSFCKSNTSASSQPAPAPKPGRESLLHALRNTRNRAA
jgi:hypothetical protein